MRCRDRKREGDEGINEIWREVAQDHPPEEVEERPARRVHVFKCPVCGNEDRIDEEDLQPWSGFCGSDNCSNREPIKESFIEIVNAGGEVMAVIV